MKEILEQVARNDSIICAEITGVPDGFSVKPVISGIATDIDNISDVADLRALATDFQYRIAWLQLRLSTFFSAIEQEQTFIFLYKGFNFNLQPEGLPKYRKTVYDALITAEKPSVKKWDLTEEDLFLCRHLPNAWSLADLYTYDPRGLPQASVDMYRLPIYYYACANKMADKAVIHPVENRCLTESEYNTLFVNSLPDFLQLQMELQTSDWWGEADWESAYDGYEQKWLGKTVTGVQEKFFDMREYRPLEPFPYKVPILQHRFNIDERGKLIHDWDTIRRVYAERKAAQ